MWSRLQLGGLLGSCDAIKCFKAEGPAGLTGKPRPGRPRRLDTAQEDDLRSAVLAGPDNETGGLSAFTLQEAGPLINTRSGVTGHTNGLGRRMHRL